MIKRFVAFYRPHRPLFALDLSMAFVRSLCAILIPLVTRHLFKLGEAPAAEVAGTVALLAMLVVVLSFSAFSNIKWGHVLGTRIETDMRGVLFRHLQKLSFSYFDKTKTGHIMSRLSNDLFTISEVAHHVPEDLFLATFTISGAFACMFWMNPTLAWIALIPLPVMVLCGILFQKRFRKNVRVMRRRVADINANIENSIQGIREVKSFASEHHAVAQFDEVNHDFRESKETMYHTMAAFHSTMMGLIHSHEILITVAGAIMVFNGKADIADILVFLMFARFMTKPIDRMVNFVEQFGQGAASFERFTEIMDIEPDIQDRPNPVEPEHVTGAIEVANLSFAYEGNDAKVLNQVSVSIKAGQTVALVGESGAGKSTLAALIPRFYEAREGRIAIDGVNVLDLRQHFLREQIGIVQQSPFLFDTTIRDNILFGNREANEEELVAAARQANILDFIESLPEGFDSPVGEHGVKLSGGQKQRVSIARVFLKNPPILIFDEATSALDTESEQLIQDAMERLCKDRTTIIIAHRLSTVKHADTIFVLRDGQVVENGTHQALTALGGYYHTLYTKSLF
ncbi:Putative multidrug export ATP-binding/permease protein [Pontiella desulfatans]|uniref:Multidrug export ATP-binding/permease protein n=1 Tax=Pontiella desulfatans TaxID=2750659 RepID=A0A6C2UCP2_PONDE|nr:ABC transporter ATP-binding protein [Pontiella desulfatans]VGO17347.1 Putative multidrug export ATP-binding/permease protein [Pontiella desulfatans]